MLQSLNFYFYNLDLFMKIRIENHIVKYPSLRLYIYLCFAHGHGYCISTHKPKPSYAIICDLSL